jgi:hypothetical protein
MIGSDRRHGLHGRLTIETTLDPGVQPFLHDHQIEGKPVLPGVMGIEASRKPPCACCPAGTWRRSRT